ncbi:hypothetical protein Hanom_Chr03g00181891 [Helianthus anomalus]
MVKGADVVRHLMRTLHVFFYIYVVIYVLVLLLHHFLVAICFRVGSLYKQPL